jgi:hypothetical protein
MNPCAFIAPGGAGTVKFPVKAGEEAARYSVGTT